jgi:hypothetical protein
MPKVRGHVWMVEVPEALGGMRIYSDKETAMQSIKDSFPADVRFEYAALATDIHCCVTYTDGRVEKVTASCYPVWSTSCPIR